MDFSDVLMLLGVVGGFVLLFVLVLLDQRYRRTRIRWELDIERRRRREKNGDEEPPDP